jgi:UDP-galactopyranose mutase
MKKAIVVGGGFAGCCMAHQLELMGGWQVTILERSSLLGAGVRTRYHGGHPYTFGPRHFLTPYEETYKYLENIVPMRRCSEHEFTTYIEADDQFYNYPINADDIPRMPEREQIDRELEDISASNGVDSSRPTSLEEYWIRSVGPTLFKKLIEPYNKKMWLVESCKEIDTFSWSPKGVTLKRGSRAAWDTAISAYPIAKNGYDDFFPFATKNATIVYNCLFERYDPESKTVLVDGQALKADLVINTIGPDTFLGNNDLSYYGRNLELLVLPVEYALPDSVYFCYYAGKEKYTRCTEYKKFTLHKSKSTLLSLEYVKKGGGQDYPSPFRAEQRKAQSYLDSFGSGVLSIGRAGSYLYGIDMDDCVRQSLLAIDMLRSGLGSSPVPGADYRFPEL